MASEFREGESVFFAFCNGKTELDSQNKPRMYKTRKQFEGKFPFLQNKCVELIEYAPVIRCKNCKHAFKRSGRKLLGCYLHGKNGITLHNEDDFCSFGERLKEFK